VDLAPGNMNTFNIIFPSTLQFPKWSFSAFPTKNSELEHFYLFTLRVIPPCQAHAMLLDLIVEVVSGYE
jgi:hypothetical protein